MADKHVYRTRVPKGMSMREFEEAERTKETLREHILRGNRPAPREDVKEGHYTRPDDPTWKPREHTTINRGSRYSRDPKICRHQFAGNKQFCPYCATTNPDFTA